MRRFVCLVLALALSASLAPTAFAAFTPSVSVKDTPAVDAVTDKSGKEVKNEKGQSAVATFVRTDEKKENKTERYVFEGSLIFTSVADANKKNDEKPDDKKDEKSEDTKDEELSEREQEIRQELNEVHEKLENGEMEIPYEEFELDADKMVIRDLFDVSWHPAEADGIDGETFEELMDKGESELHITFDLGLAPDVEIHVFTYKDHTPNDGKDEKTWGEIVSATNNGDGTFDCVFDHLCPVAVCVEADDIPAPTDTTTSTTSSEENSENEEVAGRYQPLWIGLMAVAAVALVTVVVAYKKKKN